MREPIWNTETSVEIAARQPRFAVIPIGSFEQHGKHLPVTTDTLIAGLIGKALCEAHGGLLVSPITVTCSHEHAGFPGSLSIHGETLARVLKDMIGAIEASGIALTVLLNGHGGNYVVGNVAQELNVSGPRVAMTPTRAHWEAAVGYAGIKSTLSEDMHGGEIETSMLLHAMPDVVRTDEIEDWGVSERPWLTLYGMRYYTPSGIIGFPSRATPEKGRRLLEKLVDVIGRDVEEILANR